MDGGPQTSGRRGVEIVSGLHQRLAPELPGKPVWDVREPPKDIPLFSGDGLEVKPKIALTVGTANAIGKMTATLEVQRAAEEVGVSAQFVATGQTGIIWHRWPTRPAWLQPTPSAPPPLRYLKPYSTRPRRVR